MLPLHGTSSAFSKSSGPTYITYSKVVVPSTTLLLVVRPGREAANTRFRARMANPSLVNLMEALGAGCAPPTLNQTELYLLRDPATFTPLMDQELSTWSLSTAEAALRGAEHSLIDHDPI